MQLRELAGLATPGPVFVRKSGDGLSWVVKPVPGQVVADFPATEQGRIDAVFDARCRNGFMPAFEVLERLGRCLMMAGPDDSRYVLVPGTVLSRIRELVAELKEVEF